MSAQEPGRATKGKITAQTARRRKRAVDLREAGYGFAEIAEDLDVSVPYAWKLYHDALKAIPVASVDQHRRSESARLEKIANKLTEILDGDHPLVSNGRRFDDLTDNGPVIAAARELRQISESLRKLYGVDAPTRTQAEVTTVDMTSNPIVQQLEARNAARRAALEEENGDG